MSHRFPYYRMAAAFTLAVNNFFIGEHCAECFTPVHRYFIYVGKSFFIQLDKNPLRPFVVFRICRVNFSVPVVAETKFFDLTAEVIDILLVKSMNIITGVNCILLCRQTKGVPAHRVEHIVALHAFHAADDICRCVAFRMTDVKSGT